MYTFSIKEIVEFYDTKAHKGGKHASALTGIIGEELAASLIKHYFDSLDGHNAKLLGITPTRGARRGNRLDEWILVKNDKEEFLYQTEIKNRSSHSIGGKELLFNASKEEALNVAHLMYTSQWDEKNHALKYPQTQKVLQKMNPPEGYKHLVRPLICFWFPIIPKDNIHSDGCLSRVQVKNESFDFEELDIFSLSLYLRSLSEKGHEYVEMDLPLLKERETILRRMFITTSEEKIIQ